MKKALPYFLFFGLIQAAFAACYPDTNLILCWETQEGIGVVTADASRSGLTGTLNGGPAWVKASKPQAFGHTVTTMTSTNMGDNTISFPGTINVEVDSPNTNIFDFSGNKPYTVAFSFQSAGFPLNDNKCIVGFTDAGNNGWGVYMNTAGQFIIAHIAAANSPASPPITDTNPHRFLVTRNVGTLLLYIDGKRIQTVTGQGDMNPTVGNNPLGLPRLIASATSEWNGKAGNLAVYNMTPGPSPQHADAFAMNEYLYWQGGAE